MPSKHYGIYGANTSAKSSNYATSQESWNRNNFMHHYEQVSNPNYPFGKCAADPKYNCADSSDKNNQNVSKPMQIGLDGRGPCIITPQGGIYYYHKTS